jgi:hypothetical protein
MYKEPNPLLNRIMPLAIVVLAVGGSFLLFKDDINKQSQKVDRIRAQTEQTEQDRIQLDIAKQRAEQLNPLLKQLNAAETERATQEEAIASQRVKSNCLWVDANSSPQKVIAGASLLYPTTQAPLQPGEVVCDRSGNTGVIGSNGLVDPTSVARTRARTPWEYHTSTWFKQQGGK